MEVKNVWKQKVDWILIAFKNYWNNWNNWNAISIRKSLIPLFPRGNYWNFFLKFFLDFPKNLHFFFIFFFWVKKKKIVVVISEWQKKKGWGMKIARKNGARESCIHIYAIFHFNGSCCCLIQKGVSKRMMDDFCCFFDEYFMKFIKFSAKMRK